MTENDFTSHSNGDIVNVLTFRDLFNVGEDLPVKVYPDQAKAKNSRRFSNRAWTYWSESESEKDAKDCVDANESTQTKSESESDVAFAFARSALTLKLSSSLSEV